MFCDEHREQLLRIFAQNLRIQHLHHRAFNTEGSNCYYYGRVLRIAIARCESELACPIVPRLLSTSHSHQIVDVCYEAKTDIWKTRKKSEQRRFRSHDGRQDIGESSNE